MADVFISHIEEDSETATTVAGALEASGFSTWYYERDTVPGVSYLVQTGQAIERAKVVLLVISHRALGSHQMTKEVVRAHEENKPFFPILVDVADAEFKKRQPEWREAIGAAASISLKRGLSDVVASVIQGLRTLGLQPDVEPARTVSDGRAVLRDNLSVVDTGGRDTGDRYVLLGSLKRLIQEYCGEGVAHIGFTYGDDGWIDGIHEIRINEPRGTFRLFTDDSDPSVMAFLSKVFRNPGEPVIRAIAARHDDSVFEKESRAKRDELTKKYKLDPHADWIHEMESGGKEPYRRAQDEWVRWVDDVTVAIRFVS